MCLSIHVFHCAWIFFLIKIMTAKQKIFEKIKEAPKTRKELMTVLGYASTTTDTILRELVAEGKIKYEINQEKQKRLSGMQYFVKEPNHKVRVYSLVEVSEKV